MQDPSALQLPDNYQISYMRHLSLRNAFSKLEPDAQKEFTQPMAKTPILRRPPGPGVTVGHYLPANFVLKTQGPSCLGFQWLTQPNITEEECKDTKGLKPQVKNRTNSHLYVYGHQGR